MKKFIKISLLILFIIFILGITTSNAWTVIPNNSSSAKEFTTESQVIDGREFCIQKQAIRFTDADYETTEWLHYPEDNKTIGYALAYAYAAKDDIKSTDDKTLDNSDVQKAIWIILGQDKEENAVSYLAKAYQTYKENEKDITITEDPSAKLFSQGDKLVYGPFKITYSYGYAKYGSYYDQWGGFSYALFDSNNENANNVCDKVKICTLTDGEYQEIDSSLITTDNQVKGYYEVNTNQYNGQDLYIVTTNNRIPKVYLRVRSNKVEYSAAVHQKKGQVYNSSGGMSLCSSCLAGTKKIGDSYWKADSTEEKEVDKLGENSIVINGNELTEYTYTKETVTETATWYENVPCLFMPGPGVDKKTCKWCHQVVSVEVAGGMCSKTIKKTGTIQKTIYKLKTTKYHKVTGCGAWVGPNSKEGYYQCGVAFGAGFCSSQKLEEVDSITSSKGYGDELLIEIELSDTIEITKKWNDYGNQYNLRPEELHFDVYRSTDKQNWEILKENEDYFVTIGSKELNEWKILISGLIGLDDSGNDYYFKVKEKGVPYYDPDSPDGYYVEYEDDYPKITINNSLKKINIGGYVWLDGQTGIKPAIPNNGIMDDSEVRMENIVVYLYYRNPIDKTITKVAETVTDKNGHYEFKDNEIGFYHTEFYYDGVHYEDTVKIENGSSKAFEKDEIRNTFNGRFETITYRKAKDGTILNYNYEDRKSTLITNEDGKTTIKKEFQMTAETPLELINTSTDNLNLGLVTRGTDLALSTDVYDAKVKINGQTTDYKYNKDDNSIEIEATQTSEQVTYNLNLYTSDYKYRIRDYANTQNFQEKDYINEENPVGLTTGEDLSVYIIYELNLQNQSTKTTKVNEVKYTYDEKYNYIGLQGNSYSVEDVGNTLTLNLNGLELKEGETKTLYLIFEVKKTDNEINLGEYLNRAEITSYSTDEGLIDCDSQPGNFINNNEVEDDSDTAGGLKILLQENQTRKITGKVFDKEGNNVNDVIVQLIEVKEYNGKVYEYIWQETVSGAGKGLRLNVDGTALEEYTYTSEQGQYEFNGFIPGDYIVRFIYGDGTTYDMTGNVIKYNGQDYKSMPDPNYNTEWYNTSTYVAGASVARDNEARRLETMIYGVEVDASKGVLLKLLNNLTVDDLNETEKEIIIDTYNKYYGTSITHVTSDIINQLLKEQVLKNTWMCAETSKIKVAIDAETITDIGSSTTVDGKAQSYANNIENINLGLELRPETKIELKKYITGMKLVASNGQTLVNAYIDVNEYFDNQVDISNKVQGIKDNLTILNTIWQYEVVPTEINTIVDGASLEFEYTLVVKNIGDTDYLSAELANEYNNNDIETYKNILTTKVAEMKSYIRNGTYRTQIGKYVGNRYYDGQTAGTGKVLTEVTNIRDYINNDLTFVFEYSGKVDLDNDAPRTHRLLRDDYSMQNAEIKTILKTTETTGKMDNLGDTRNAVMYKVKLGKNPISSTGNLNFDNYIAEVMSYTNAAGRRAMTETPGNAEIVDSEYREGKSHEIDEADTGRIQIGVATGNDQTINYIIIIAVAAGIALVAIGAYIVKKYIIK
ncbi:MAG: Cna B-type domain-containing protein [Clostridia bacterium]